MAVGLQSLGKYEPRTARRSRRDLERIRFVFFVSTFSTESDAFRAVARTAGSTRVPGACGCGWTSTRPATTRTAKVGTFSVKGGGDAPVSGAYSYPCHGHTT